MAIYRLIQKISPGQMEAAVLAGAYERTLVTLGITDRTDPITQRIATAILHMWREGETDVLRLSQLACLAVKSEPQPAHSLKLASRIPIKHEHQRPVARGL